MRTSRPVSPHTPSRSSARRDDGFPSTRGVALLVALLVTLLAPAAVAAPEAHILRIDPRASQQSGEPVITTVIELVQARRVSDATGSCAALNGNARLDCMSDALEKKNALYSPFDFQEQNAIFTVDVDGTDHVAKHLSNARWGDSGTEPGVGTAWLLLIDADARMGKSLDDAKQLAERFIASMGPNDIVNVMFLNDTQVVKDSKWLPSTKKPQASQFVESVSSTYPKLGTTRPLLTIIKAAATDAFKSLGNVGGEVEVPLHQAMVVLSSGYGGGDPATTGPGALELQKYLTGGRFPEDNTALPKAPVPVISIYFPPRTFDAVQRNALEFMQNLANTQIGGFFSIMRAGQGSRSDDIVNAVRTRFSKMHIVRWRVSCIAPSITQSFKLVFKNITPPIAGDTTFKDVPIGIDPTTWALDVNVKDTQARVTEGVYPGGNFKVYGDFCWGGDVSRAEVYFVPAGQSIPADLGGADIDQAKKTQQHLIAQGMRGTAVQVADGFAEFQAPDNDKILHGSGSQAVVRLVIYDNKARRMSGATASTILQLKATSAPFPLVIVLGAALGLTVLALVAVLLLRGSRRRPSASRPTPAPVVAGGVYPAPAPHTSRSAGSAPRGGASPSPGRASKATLEGAAGVYSLVAGQEMQVGRDGAVCTILLSDPQVSGVHATLKIDDGSLVVRDEHSNNGTSVGGAALTPGTWATLSDGAIVSFGPIEFRVKLD